MTDVRLLLGDCLEMMKTIPGGSVDAVVTDPPAGIGFMGEGWDRDHGGRDRWVEWLTPRMAEALRIARPGSYALVWALPRTSHWTAMAIEDAGWTIRDRVSHLFGQGFPKAKSCLKPACEDWWLAWKPAAKVTPLQIDACRVSAPDGLASGGRCVGSSPNPMSRSAGLLEDRERSAEHPAGRWPANVVLSHAEGCVEVGSRKVKAGWAGGPDKPGCFQRGVALTTPHPGCGEGGTETVPAWECVEGCPVAILDAQSGTLKSGKVAPHHMRNATAQKNGGGYGGNFRDVPLTGHGDSGGASRFFYTAKASRSDRGEGNTHPTVKSIALMRWLCRLITPPGGTVADPFAGSGTTGVAAVLEGFGFLGFESDPDYFAIAERRIAEARAATPLFAEAAP